MAEEAQSGNGIKIFGFEIKRSAKENPKPLPSIVPPQDDDGAGYVTAGAMHYGQYVNLDGDESKDNQQMVMKYRGVANHPEVDDAIENIINEAISASNEGSPVELNLENVDASDKIKKQMEEEFSKICKMLNFTENGHDMFKRWYIDGRMYHHLVVDEKSPKLGIQEIRNIDASKIRKLKQIKKQKDAKSGADVITKVDEFYLYQEKPGQQKQGVKLSLDSVSYVTSGILDDKRKKVVSHLHKAIKPINQLRMMEDSLVIYRLARAPERRIFYIDVGNLPRGKSEQYLKDIMARYRNKLVYDANTGELKDDRKHMSMLEDFWLPRREGGRGTEISTLPGGQNLGELSDIKYFQEKLYRSLNVPTSRIGGQEGFNLGRSSEILRDELKFTKFVGRLRKRFSAMFNDLLKTQLILKNIVSPEDWNTMSEHIQYDFLYDNHFSELKDAELMTERLNIAATAEPYIGKYYSQDYVRRKILRQTDEEIIEQDKLIKQEIAAGIIPDPNAPIDPATGEPMAGGGEDLGEPIQEPNLDGAKDGGSTEAPEIV